MPVLLSIKPEYVEKIFAGEKNYEYRKAIFKRTDVDKVVVYSSSPVKRIVGEFTIETILRDTPNNIWKRTSNVSGVNKGFFFEYFGERDTAYAIKISKPVLYDEPIDPRLENKNFVAPQSFMYLDDPNAGKQLPLIRKSA